MESGLLLYGKRKHENTKKILLLYSTERGKGTQVSLASKQELKLQLALVGPLRWLASLGLKLWEDVYYLAKVPCINE